MIGAAIGIVIFASVVLFVHAMRPRKGQQVPGIIDLLPQWQDALENDVLAPRDRSIALRPLSGLRVRCDEPGCVAVLAGSLRETLGPSAGWMATTSEPYRVYCPKHCR